MIGGSRRVSRLWSATALLAFVIGAAALVVALRHQAEASRPVGEGELFAVEAITARHSLTGTTDPDAAVRALRNALTVEAVALVDDEGAYVAATSPSLVGTVLENPLLRSAIGTSTFRAVTATPGVPITIDGVTEWDADDVLYVVAQPLEPDGAVVLMYDVAELTERRFNETGIHPATLQIGAVGLAFFVTAAVLLVGRAGARRRLRATLAETEHMAHRADELARLNKTLDEARAQAEKALALAEEKIRIRSEFVLMINHELRTPLTGVVTSAELLMNDPEIPAAERTALLADMVREGERLRGMISRMLTVARIENRGLGYTLRDVPVDDVVGGLRTGHPALIIEGDPAAGTLIRTDPEGLVALLSSLADNAVSHGAESVVLRISEELPFEPVAEVGTRPDTALFLLVSDDGPGIAPSFLPRLFQKFEKSSPSSGTGLGLYLARLMVEAMQGLIAVDTGPQGTTMAVAIPLVGTPVESRR